MSSVQFKVGTLKRYGTEDINCADCLTKNGYNEAKCQKAIDALYECCSAFYQRHGDEASSPSCPKPDLLRLKMKQREQKQ